ncbi:MAG TPA: diacylglycerol kinase family protein [Terriglobales bacterium]|nr:diacylglycerol kinase family protein [Terriglobales bacterium]
MRAAAILGPGDLARPVANFQRQTRAEWTSLIEQADVAVIFGGDGTIHHQLADLVELDVPLLVVPCGSGNDFARALNVRRVSDSVTAYRRFAASSTVRTIDLGIIRELETAGPGAREHYFCCVAGVGIDAAIAKRANALPRWVRGHGGYAISAPREFFRFAPFPMAVSCNGAAARSRPVILAAVANAPAFGGGMKIAPEARLDDGKLDVCIVGGMDVFKLFCLFPTVFFGRHLGFKEVEYRQTTSVKIETEYPLDVYADGEFVCPTPVEITVARNALKVIVP